MRVLVRGVLYLIIITNGAKGADEAVVRVTSPTRLLPNRDVTSLAISDDGSILAAAGRHEISIWDADSGQLLKTELNSHACLWDSSGAGVMCGAYGVGRLTLVTSGCDGNVVAVDLRSGREKFTLSAELLAGQLTRPASLKRVPARAFDVTSDFKIACVAYGPIVLVWDVPNEKLLGRLGKLEPVKNVSTDKLAAMPCPLWDSRAKLLEYLRYPRDTVGRVAETLAVWDVDLSKSNNVHGVDISGDNRLVAASTMAGVDIWDLQTFELARRVKDATSGRFRNSGAELVTGGRRVSVEVWDTTGWRTIRRLEGRGEIIRTLKERDEVVVKRPQSIDFLSLASGICQLRLTDTDEVGEPIAVAVTPDGSRVAATWSRINERKVWLWDITRKR